jgi:uncharacterized protein YjcR
MSDCFQTRWQAARKMWDLGYSTGQIAEIYDVTEKGMRTRIQKWRKKFGWFPARN